jgi:hypothetical protein
LILSTRADTSNLFGDSLLSRTINLFTASRFNFFEAENEN